MAKVIVTIDEAGNARVEVEGAQGPACLEATRRLEAALGRVTGRQAKPEMYEGSGVEAGVVKVG